MPELTLRALTEAEYDARMGAMIRRYSERVARDSGGSEDARQRAEESSWQLVPDGRETKGMLFLAGCVDDVAVGWIWLALPESGNQPDGTAFVYNVEVDEDHRGRGYGRGIMDAAEAELGDRGIERLGLHVFADNETAVGLYERLGYRYVSHNMSKPIGRADQ